eukprot:6481721-Amphidinium_carterae.1
MTNTLPPESLKVLPLLESSQSTFQAIHLVGNFESEADLRICAERFHVWRHHPGEIGKHLAVVAAMIGAGAETAVEVLVCGKCN